LTFEELRPHRPDLVSGSLLRTFHPISKPLIVDWTALVIRMVTIQIRYSFGSYAFDVELMPQFRPYNATLHTLDKWFSFNSNSESLQFRARR
jgi:hypothetical protein